MGNDKILELAKEYGLRAEWKSNDILYIHSGFNDEWYIEPEQNELKLKHKNKNGNRVVSKHYHEQRSKRYGLNDYPQIFKKIKEHDEYRLIKNIKNRKMKLFWMIENNYTQKIKLN